ncbi:MAG: UPF0262 family protein, partial [Alphaproteobacteria bacterium]|nr:UPF0262 family protein [Alphaproteobacteria bacterium]
MSFFAGLACAYPVEQRETERLGSIAVTYGGGKGRLWRGDTAALILTPRAFTPEDRLDRLPAAFMGGMSHLVFDGRLDNRNELIASLNLPAPDAARLGDAALVMAALERWGVDACPRFIGAFALAWWNELDRRLVLDIATEAGQPVATHILSLTPFRRIIKDYFMICESYYAAIRSSTPSQIEAIDMGRRGIHNEGSQTLMDRLDGKIL